MFNKKKGAALNLSTENITTIIAEDCKIEGNIECKEFIRIDGQTLGNVNSTCGLVVGQKGSVKGDIRTKELIVYGQIDGDIFVDNLSLKNSGSIIGNMQVKSFQVENGALYKGTVSMDQNNSTPVNKKENNSQIVV
ncbi:MULTISPECIES: polymer-forming cytoskeletal protein [Apibacter]|uniref:bactofilin family protein n=1 Tax=Apibacter TaxID=1778601 RepID=UPI0013233216|nr:MULTISPECIES: polymer-forming cytoskeletal protein [Apibacter]MXO33076.1 polymer-forming cytoskeletal protein [Apibacter sp. B2912]MXO34992.1 polymer-forming cytoskeletal protein [Apibacter sp. B3883]MXO41903.1 polymer-forming cytoskeletal protein [Apibacter sp. B3889]MXP03473.1 polymer-forming cytoskeletal protein [Apibacter sp. B3887]MXP08290.1 polymer-forming cytoskeletal protein [Apibacter sp. B3935]